MASLQLFDILIITIPIAVIAVIYWLIPRIRKRPLSTPVCLAFLTTLSIISIWGVVLLVWAKLR